MEAGIEQYYNTKNQDLQVVVNVQAQNVRRLQAQRNELNAKGSPFFRLLLLISILREQNMFYELILGF